VELDPKNANLLDYWWVSAQWANQPALSLHLVRLGQARFPELANGYEPEIGYIKFLYAGDESAVLKAVPEYTATADPDAGPDTDSEMLRHDYAACASSSMHSGRARSEIP